ncbi:hypothetical protein CI102_2741 [Trichoderma harzianum]|nr:hypothetical protein CI102_2741 [Trichoderma harzianum]
MDTQSGVAEEFLGGFEQTSSITEEEAQERIDLLVTPEDEKWNDVLQEFQRLFADPDMTIGRILSDKFTTHEARLFIPSELAVLKAIQEENTRDFYDLLGSRFQGVTPDIPTKLTMLYFGLHVEPMDFQLAKMTFKMESRKPEPPRYAIDPPLHFLTAHKERNYGKDMLRGKFDLRDSDVPFVNSCLGKEDPSYPIPVEPPQSWLSSLSNTFLTEQHSQIEQPTVRLRGGGASDDSDCSQENDAWNGGDDDDFAGSESNGEHGNEDSDYEDNTPEDQLHREEKEAEDATMENIDNDGDYMPCFFIGPNTTDKEWFSIRARIPTPSAKIKILDSKAWNWRDQVDKTNIWGPRYGRVADIQAAIEKPEDEDAREQEEEGAPQDRAEEPAQEAVQTPVRDSSVGVEAVRARLRETELVKMTHPEPAKTQRLGRNASGDSDMRQRSWLHQPSVYDNFESCSQSNSSGIQIPTNGPSVEHQLRTGDNMPNIATRFRTLTEQARLQRALWDMRNIRLNRIPPLMLRKCMFCNGIIPKHWSKERVHRHLREKHRNELMEALGVTKATIRRFDGKGVISIPLKRVERRLNPSPVALANDDMVVDQPETQSHRQKKGSEFCDRCGDDGNNCEVDTHHPAQDGRDQNRNSCKGSRAERGRYCRYCGDEFSGNANQADWDRNAAHMVACYKKNDEQKSLFLPPDVAAFNQQQDNLRMQINEAETGAVDSHEEEELPSIEAVFRAADSEAEQSPEEMDLDESDEEPRRPRPTKRFHVGRSGEESTDPSKDGTVTVNRALVQAVNRAINGCETPLTEALDPDAHQKALPTALERVLANIPLDEFDVSSPSMTRSRAASQPANSDPLAAESEKEPEVSQPETQKMAESPELQSPESSESEPDNGSDFENEPDQDKSDDEESEDDPHGDPSSSKRHKRGGKKRGKKGDRNYTFSGDEDDDEDSETDEDGKRTRPPRRAPSPNWGLDDPKFEPTDDYYCSKCFRKAPKKHKRDRSPLGRTKEIELHYDKNRCCGIRRGIGSTKRLPNRSGWIPSAAMPKPLGNLRKQFLRRYPAYSRTLYPLNASNANGSYWRSDPNNDDNKGCWDIPWPPFRGPTPLPNGWVAPDELNAPVTGKARKQFKLRSEGDSTYVQDKNVRYSDDEEIASDKDVNGKRKRKSRPSSAVNSRHATPTPGKIPQKPDAKAEKAATPRPVKKKVTVLQKALKGKAARPRKAAPKKTERKEPTRRSARKRQKTG